jgi:Carbamoyltransferase N-terminus
VIRQGPRGDRAAPWPRLWHRALWVHGETEDVQTRRYDHPRPERLPRRLSGRLVRDGVLVAAVEEERLRAHQHWAGFPAQAIAYGLREAGLALADVDHLVRPGELSIPTTRE